MLAFLYLIVVWLRLARLALDLVEYLGYLLLKPVGIDSASLAAQRRANTTIITATLGTEPHFEQVVRLWLKADPGEVIITTVDAQFSQVKELLDGIGDSRISLYSVDAPSARKQYYESISRVKTAFFVATDDRTRWSHTTLDAILAPFQDPSVGGVTGLQEVRPANGRQLGAWESMGALNLARRNVQHSALTYFNHGQILNLSGRLSAYRAGIFAEPGFRDAFLSELWLGRYRLNTGDDNTLTTWVVRRGWRTRFQNAEGVRVAAGTNKDATYTRQLLRWLRDTTRCYLSDLAFAIRSGERRHLSRAISNLLVYYITDFTTLLEVGFLLLVFVSRTCFDVGDEEFSTPLLHLLCEHLAISSVLTVLEHLPFFSSLESLQAFPTTVAYVYIRAGIALYSWITLHKASNFSYTKSEAIGGKMKRMAG